MAEGGRVGCHRLAELTLPVPEFCTHQIVLFFSLPMSPHSGQSSVRQAKLGVSDWVQVPIE
jgi:hypothetical protein